MFSANGSTDGSSLSWNGMTVPISHAHHRLAASTR
jgi:hypothetical protein